jgi:hypothetical protein
VTELTNPDKVKITKIDLRDDQIETSGDFLDEDKYPAIAAKDGDKKTFYATKIYETEGEFWGAYFHNPRTIVKVYITTPPDVDDI